MWRSRLRSSPTSAPPTRSCSPRGGFVAKARKSENAKEGRGIVTAEYGFVPCLHAFAPSRKRFATKGKGRATMAAPFRGVFTIPCTPFTESGELDEVSLRQEVRFCLDAGAHGLVAPVNASEFASLTDAERQRVATLLVEESAGRAPVVIGVTGASEEIAVSHARHAREIGANAVIAMPPHV